MGGRLIGALSALWSDGAGDTSVQWRLAIFRSTWTMIREHPWLGVGPGAFPVALTHVQALPYVGGENPHNLFLEIAAEYGLPAGMLAGLGLIVCVARVGMIARRLPTARPERARLAALVASLGAFAVHNGMDLDWSFPAIALVGATLLGHLVSGMPSAPASRPPLLRGRVWRGAMLLVLATAAILAGTRYAASTLVERGRAALATNNTTDAGRQFERAGQFNPLSFPAHYWLAWTRLVAGDPSGALRAAEAARSSAPQDPNTDALVGEMALAGRRWELAQVAFQRSVDRAPAAHLAFHAGLLEATAALDRRSDAIHAYERAMSLFVPERVLADESRCLAPGDRYLLARMSRIAGRLYDAGRDSRGAQAFNRAALLAQPDSRGICVTGRYPGRTSPEAAIENFWRTWHAEGWSRAEQYLLPGSRRPEPEGGARRIRVSWIHGLTGGERLATVRYEVELQEGNSRTTRCAQSTTRLTPEGWMLDGLPLIGKAPCWP
jgi:tetratricopeptide (TPR) repeat protein